MEEKKKFAEVEQAVIREIVRGEYAVAQQNESENAEDFRSFVDLLDAKRTEKEYDWMSDVRLPEFTAIFLTQATTDVAQYFTSRDFVEVYIQDPAKEAKLAAEAAKECINRTLNLRHLYYYSKFVRAKEIAHLFGPVWAECWWEKPYEERVVGTTVESNPVYDEDGNWISEEQVEVEIREEVPVKDRFNFDVLDPRNVFASPEFCYTAQEKAWVIVRSQKTYQQLLEDQGAEGYFNLEYLKDKGTLQSDTATARETDNQDGAYTSPKTSLSDSFDILKRYGKYWVVVKKYHEELGVPQEVEPGISDDGEPLEDAILYECVVSFAVDGDHATLIGFHPTPYIMPDGAPFRPLIRGQCYPHPVKDGGFGDGKHAKELQQAIDNAYNVMADRVMLATIPTFKMQRYANEDTLHTLRVSPGGIMQVDDVNQLQELTIRDNITGGLNQIGMLTNSLQQLTSVYPTTMGNLPTHTSTTATAIAGADTRSDARANFKAKTFEYTFLTELYWMILQCTYRFAEPETAQKLMGDKALDFDPSLEFYYKPISQSIESDQSKQAKIQRWIQILGFITNIQHPDVVKAFNYIMGQIGALMGDETESFTRAFLDERKPLQSGETQQPGAAGTPMSNQNGVPQSLMEMNTRELPAAVGGGA